MTEEINELRKQFQQKQLQLEAAIARNDNDRAMELTEEISMLHAQISKLVLHQMHGGKQ